MSSDEILKKAESDLESVEERLAALEQRRTGLTEERDRLSVFVSELRRYMGHKELADDRFQGLTKLDAAILHLRDTRRFLATAEIVDALLDGGFKTRSPRTNFYNGLYRKLKESIEKADSPLIKSGSKWGLKEFEEKKP